jgi:hypothetical protein
MTDLAWLAEALKARTSRRLNRACKRIRKSVATIPGPTGQVHTASPVSAVRPDAHRWWPDEAPVGVFDNLKVQLVVGVIGLHCAISGTRVRDDIGSGPKSGRSRRRLR